MNRTLYLVAYDITQDKRLTKVRQLLKGYSTGGQKSVYECFLTGGELREIIERITRMIDDKEDRVHVFTMDDRSKTHALGIGVQPRNPGFFYFG